MYKKLLILTLLFCFLVPSTALSGRARVEKTGQTQIYAAGDDGDLEKGVIWPIPRFTDNDDGTITDNLTGLIWLRKADCFGFGTWDVALVACNTLSDGECGLSDGSKKGDWRLPNVKELQSLITFGFFDPPLPNTIGRGQWTEGDPFFGVSSSYYWSSTTDPRDHEKGWAVSFFSGFTGNNSKLGDYFVWPVRSRQAPDGNQSGVQPWKRGNTELGR